MKLKIFFVFLLVWSSLHGMDIDEKKLLTSFSQGFSLAFKGLNTKEFRIQGLNEDEINFSEFMAVVDATGLDDAKRFAIQLIGFRYDDSVRIKYGNWIVLSSFDRKANAIDFIKTVNEKYFADQPKNRRAFLYTKPTGKVFYKEKSFYRKIAEVIEKNIKDEEKILYVKDIRIDPKPKEEKKNSTPESMTHNNVKSEEQKKLESLREKRKNLDEKIKNAEQSSVVDFKKIVDEQNKKQTVILQDVKELTKKPEVKAEDIQPVETPTEKNIKIVSDAVNDIMMDNNSNPTNVVIMPSSAILYYLKQEDINTPTKNCDFEIIGEMKNVGTTYFSPYQKRSKNGDVFFYIEKLKGWFIENEITEVE